jgi:hypothetical protein
MDPLLTLALEPNKRRQLPPIGYSGSMLLRWQIIVPIVGIDPLSLQAVIEAQETIGLIGYLDHGHWYIPGGDRLKAPLVEVAYSPTLDWFLTTPDGFKNAQLIFYPYRESNYSDMATINNPYSQAPAIDLSPVVNAIAMADQNSQAQTATIAGRLDQLIADNQPAMGNKWSEFKTNPWTGNSIDGKALDPDANRRSVTFSIPAVDSNSSSPNTAQVYINIGDANRTQEDDYDYIVTPGASIVITGDEAAQQICCYQATGTQATICNLTWIFK